LDLHHGALEVLFDANPQLTEFSLSTPERLEWTSSLGDRAFGYLLKPLSYVAQNKYPLVVLTYQARGFLDESTGGEYPAQVLAARGFVVFVFDRPMHYWIDVSDEERWGNDYQDRRHVQASVEAGIDILESRGLIDVNRMAITGLSDGTNMVWWELIHEPTKFATAIISSSTWEPMEMWLLTKQVRDVEDLEWHRRGRAFTADGPIPSFLSGVAPSMNAEKIRTPVLMNLPQTETVTSAPVFFTLGEHKKPFEAYIFQNEWHVKWQPSHRYNIYRRNVQWLEFWLSGTEGKYPVDPGQYQRWETLCDTQRQANPDSTTFCVGTKR
jgi:Prolyl oligopeptidase family